MLRRRVVFAVLALGCAACVRSVRADSVVRAQALRDTDCAQLDVKQTHAEIFEVQGCGKKTTYVCTSPSGVGFGNPGAASAIECKAADATAPPKAD